MNHSLPLSEKLPLVKFNFDGIDMYYWEMVRKMLAGRAIKLGLDRIFYTANAGNLLSNLPTSILVGGTNGKGSTCAYIANILIKAGYRVGIYTSPHLFHFGERICVNDIVARDDELDIAFRWVMGLPGSESLTQFEVDTLVALYLFREKKVDIMVLEVGLGGRLDATNIIDADVAIITSIDLDHQDWLGVDRESIGFEKAGIFRAHQMVFCGDANPPKTLMAHAASLGTTLKIMKQDFGFQKNDETRLQWRYWCHETDSRVRCRNLAWPGLRGEGQLQNATLAISALECLSSQFPVSMQAIREGLLCTDLPGRFQLLPGRPAVVLDVAHNPQAAGVLAENLAGMGFHPGTWAVFGMLADKDVEGVAARMAARVDRWLPCTLPGPRGLSADALAERLRAAGVAEKAIGERFASPAAAFAFARESAMTDDRIVAFGSFLTVADVLAAIRCR